MAPKQDSNSTEATALLWAAKLKREHGFLLERMQKLEAAIGSFQDTTQRLNAKVVNNVQATQDVQQQVSISLGNLQSQVEAITDKVAQVEKTFTDAASERREEADQKAALVERIREIDSSLKSYRNNMQALGRRYDERRIQQIAEHLEKLTKQAEDRDKKVARLQETVEVLEKACGDINDSNNKLIEELRVIQDNITARGILLADKIDEVQDDTSALDDVPEDVPEDVVEPAPNKVAERAPTARTAKDTKHKKTSQTKRATLQEARASRTQKRTGAEEEVASSKPGADKAKAAVAKAARPVKRKNVPASKKAADLKTTRALKAETKGDAPPPSPAIDARSQLPIVRKGKGWVEVEQSTTPVVPQRRTIAQDDNTQAQAIFGGGLKGKKRKADVLADETIAVDAPRKTRRQAAESAVMKEDVAKKPRRSIPQPEWNL